MKEIHYFYKITNLINNHFYYGIRTCHCFPGRDPYIGSGVRLHRAYRKYGIENFKKEIIRVCKTREDVLDLEAWVVDDNLVNNQNCYNLVKGEGEGSFYKGVTVIDELKGHKIISVEEYRNNKNYISHISGKTPVYDTILNKIVWISSDEYYTNKNRYKKTEKQLEFIRRKGHITVKDKLGNYSLVFTDDPRYLSGELVPIWKGRKHSEESKQKISKSNSVSNKGKNNSQYGIRRIWVTNGLVNRRVLPDELDSYLSNGYMKGYRTHNPKISESKNNKLRELNSDSTSRFSTNKGRINITNGVINKCIKLENLSEYLSKGWRKGLTQFKVHSHNPNSGNKGKRWINCNGIRKLIDNSELEYYISNGWILGR